ncbi:hypothetical protein BVY04_01480 [bacterium M21]|nr:hypothetical protein BVY04_01480 [bacterium M21]
MARKRKAKNTGKDFEEAVLQFVQALDPTAKVLFDHYVPDRETGVKRQCDVWIEAKLGGHIPFSVYVSCKDYKRKLDSNHIDTFIREREVRSASMGIIYSRAGFYGPALAKAKLNGVSCCRLFQNEPSEMPDVLFLDQYYCTPRFSASINMAGHSFNNWSEILAHTFRCDDEEATGCELIANALVELQKKAMEDTQADKYPEQLTASMSVSEPNSNKQGVLKANLLWRRYSARQQFILLNGSYSVSDGGFKGEIQTPYIDMQGAHPGEGWEEISEEEYAPSTSMIKGCIVRPMPDDIETMCELVHEAFAGQPVKSADTGV